MNVSILSKALDVMIKAAWLNVIIGAPKTCHATATKSAIMIVSLNIALRQISETKIMLEYLLHVGATVKGLANRSNEGRRPHGWKR